MNFSGFMGLEMADPGMSFMNTSGQVLGNLDDMDFGEIGSGFHNTTLQQGQGQQAP